MSTSAQNRKKPRFLRKKLYAILESRGMTQEHIAFDAVVSVGSIKNWITGKSLPNAENSAKVALALGKGSWYFDDAIMRDRQKLAAEKVSEAETTFPVGALRTYLLNNPKDENETWEEYAHRVTPEE